MIPNPIVIKFLGVIIAGLLVLTPFTHGGWSENADWFSGNFQELHFNTHFEREPSPEGINKGRITSLIIIQRKGGKIVLDYDHGWKVKPDDPEMKNKCDYIVKELEKAMREKIKMEKQWEKQGY